MRFVPQRILRLLTITVGVYGFAPTGSSLRRSGTRPGDEIFVTGTLGDAALALTLVGLPSPHQAYLETRLRRPTPRVAEGLSLRALASSGIDVSDGLAADLCHLLTQSGCGATVYLERLPLSPALRAVDDPDRRRALALGGGDDYELCFTVPPPQRPMLESRWRGAPMTSIGRIEASPGLRFLRGRQRLSPASRGLPTLLARISHRGSVPRLKVSMVKIRTWRPSSHPHGATGIGITVLGAQCPNHRPAPFDQAFSIACPR